MYMIVCAYVIASWMVATFCDDCSAHNMLDSYQHRLLSNLSELWITSLYRGGVKVNGYYIWVLTIHQVPAVTSIIGLVYGSVTLNLIGLSFWLVINLLVLFLLHFTCHALGCAVIFWARSISFFVT